MELLVTKLHMKLLVTMFQTKLLVTKLHMHWLGTIDVYRINKL